MHIATKKLGRKKSKRLCLMGQIVIESDSFLEYWQNRKIHVVWPLKKEIHIRKRNVNVEWVRVVSILTVS